MGPAVPKYFPSDASQAPSGDPVANACTTCHAGGLDRHGWMAPFEQHLQAQRTGQLLSICLQLVYLLPLFLLDELVSSCVPLPHDT